jgi:hypothetical protein
MSCPDEGFAYGFVKWGRGTLWIGIVAAAREDR